jgi:hypothetical protein
MFGITYWFFFFFFFPLYLVSKGEEKLKTISTSFGISFCSLSKISFFFRIYFRDGN